MIVVITPLCGESIEIEVELMGTTVLNLKEAIHAKDRKIPPPNCQRLIMGGRQLENDHPISEYDISESSKINLIVRLADPLISTVGTATTASTAKVVNVYKAPVKVFAPPMRVEPNEIEEIFLSLDDDNSGALDEDELRHFLTGRYDMDAQACQIIFTQFDKDSSRTIDKEELKKIIDAANSLVNDFDDEEYKFLERAVMRIEICNCLEFCCCLFTLGISSYYENPYTRRIMDDRRERSATKSQRLKALIAKKLAKTQALEMSR